MSTQAPAPPAVTPTPGLPSIPSLSELAKGAGSTRRAAARATTPEAPTPPTSPRAPSLPPSSPVVKMEPPAGADLQDISDIPLDVRAPIVKKEEDEARPPKAPKEPSEFSQQRRDAKDKRRTLEELETAHATTMAEFERIKQEREQLATEKTKVEEERETFRKLAHEREETIKESDEKYFKQFSSSVDPSTDSELVAAHKSLYATLQSKMPTHIGTENGQKRVMMGTLLANPTMANDFQTVVGHYAKGLAEDNEKLMDWAVNWGAKLIGAPVEVLGIDDRNNKYLAPDDPTFLKIEEALRDAVPHLQTKLERFQYIQNSAPQIIEDRFRTREKAIAADLSKALIMEQPEYTKILKTDPTNSLALVSAIVDRAPVLKEELMGMIAEASETLATMNDQLQLPPPKSKDKESLAAHKVKYLKHRERIGKLTKDAMIGAIAGKIIASLVGERDALQTRVNKIAKNENPGDGPSGGDGNRPPNSPNVQDTSDIPVDVRAYKPGQG